MIFGFLKIKLYVLPCPKGAIGPKISFMSHLEGTTGKVAL